MGPKLDCVETMLERLSISIDHLTVIEMIDWTRNWGSKFIPISFIPNPFYDEAGLWNRLGGVRRSTFVAFF